MSDVILKVEDISKQYRLGLVGTGTLSHDINRLWHKIRGKEDPYLKVGAVNDRSEKASSDYVWALQDINFEVKRGEILGIIGKNGAGKSTLLKILSRVTSPTTGNIKSKGRIASLLEVGTGMHPELTGRENIYLNGAILGMTKAEIASKIDEIIDFSGCQMYIDTPVKRYSSGMRVRLGFAVAAFLEPDILVVDEVLAVGDAEFQKKAIGKMQDISNTSGRTVLFVSHNMASIRSLCTRAIVMEKGMMAYDGEVAKSLEFYMSQGVENSQGLKNLDYRKGTGLITIKSIQCHGENTADLLETGRPFYLDIELDNPQKVLLQDVKLDIRIDDHLGQRLLWYSTRLDSLKKADKVCKQISFETDKLALNQGVYNLTCYLEVNDQISDWVTNIFTFQVQKGYYYEGNRTVAPNQAKVLTHFDIKY